MNNPIWNGSYCKKSPSRARKNDSTFHSIFNLYVIEYLGHQPTKIVPFQTQHRISPKSRQSKIRDPMLLSYCVVFMWDLKISVLTRILVGDETNPNVLTLYSWLL